MTGARDLKYARGVSLSFGDAAAGPPRGVRAEDFVKLACVGRGKSVKNRIYFVSNDWMIENKKTTKLYL